MSEAWPPPLKDWVAKCLGQMTDSNRGEVQAELKQVIGQAFTSKTLWTTDWNGVQLQSLMPKPPLHLKRKLEEKPSANKKKKPSIKPGYNTHPNTLDPNDQAALSRRAERFQREHEIERQKSMRGAQAQDSTIQVTPHYNLINRIQNDSRSASPASWSNDEPEAASRAIDWKKHTIIGTNESLFKDYLRLTSDPDPKDIRPYHVLQRTLLELKKHWKQRNDYVWICNQFKSMRQDLTVQRINNEFTVQVYEIHARIALEAGDMVEYNQCQHMLKNLYDMGIHGCNDEFTAYRILLLLHGMNRGDINLLVGQLTGKQKQQSYIKHALEVQRAMSTNNYHAFFQFYQNAPNMGAYIMDHFVDRERAKALMIMSKAYLQLPLSFIQDEFAFDKPTEAIDFLVEHKSALFLNPNSPDSQKAIDCKAIQQPLLQCYEDKYRKVTIKGAI